MPKKKLPAKNESVEAIKLPARITADMKLRDVIMALPSSIPIFIEHGLHCFGCHMAAFETVSDVAGEGADAKKLLSQLNEELKLVRASNQKE
ncbi:MAG: DUF1858 domain-containing protein [archaeon]